MLTHVEGSNRPFNVVVNVVESELNVKSASAG